MITTLCVGDSYVNRVSTYIDTRLHSSSVFDITGLGDVKFYGSSGRLISSDSHLSLKIAAVRQHQPRYVIVFKVERFRFTRPRLEHRGDSHEISDISDTAEESF